MNSYDIKRLALVLSIQAEIEGMKAENENRRQQELTMAYDDKAFCDEAKELRALAYKSDEQL